MTPDYYALLGLQPNATPRDIQLAYRRGAIACHPDRDSSPDALKRAQALGEAYAVLRDPQKRREYDLVRVYEQGFPRPGSGTTSSSGTTNAGRTNSVHVDFNFSRITIEDLFETINRVNRGNGHLRTCTCKSCRPDQHPAPFAFQGGKGSYQNSSADAVHLPSCQCFSCKTEKTQRDRRNAFESMRQAVNAGMSPQEFWRHMDSAAKTADDNDEENGL